MLRLLNFLVSRLVVHVASNVHVARSLRFFCCSRFCVYTYMTCHVCCTCCEFMYDWVNLLCLIFFEILRRYSMHTTVEGTLYLHLVPSKK